MHGGAPKDLQQSLAAHVLSCSIQPEDHQQFGSISLRAVLQVDPQRFVTAKLLEMEAQCPAYAGAFMSIQPRTSDVGKRNLAPALHTCI